jgi:hypothetical protein
MVPARPGREAKKARQGRGTGQFEGFENDLHQKTEFISPINVICPCQALSAKIFCFSEIANHPISNSSCPTEGRCATSNNAGQDVMDAAASGMTRDGRADWRKICEPLTAG